MYASEIRCLFCPIFPSIRERTTLSNTANSKQYPIQNETEKIKAEQNTVCLRPVAELSPAFIRKRRRIWHQVERSVQWMEWMCLWHIATQLQRGVGGYWEHLASKESSLISSVMESVLWPPYTVQLGGILMGRLSSVPECLLFFFGPYCLTW